MDEVKIGQQWRAGPGGVLSGATVMIKYIGKEKAFVEYVKPSDENPNYPAIGDEHAWEFHVLQEWWDLVKWEKGRRYKGRMSGAIKRCIDVYPDGSAKVEIPNNGKPYYMTLFPDEIRMHDLHPEETEEKKPDLPEIEEI